MKRHPLAAAAFAAILALTAPACGDDDTATLGPDDPLTGSESPTIFRVLVNPTVPGADDLTDREVDELAGGVCSIAADAPSGEVFSLMILTVVPDTWTTEQQATVVYNALRVYCPDELARLGIGD